MRRVGHKYRAVPTFVHGVRFASKAESRRYHELLLLGAAGEIRNLELQPRFDLHVGGVKVATYVADFRYQELKVTSCCDAEWRDVLEDVKGMLTPVYKMKRRHVEAEYGIAIREVRMK